MIKFLHMADVHLDTVFQNRDARLRSLLRDAVRETFQAGVDLALASGCQAMLIGGDLFDNQTLSFVTEKFLLSEMQRLALGDVQVFYATGNHDPSGDIYRARKIRWPANVHIFAQRTPEVVPLINKEGLLLAMIAGAGHETPREGENIASLFPEVSREDVPHLALLHALVTESSTENEHERYAPCTLQDLKEKGYHYWALGHVHRRSVFSENPYIVYPGNLVGRNPRETGSKGAYLVEIDDFGHVKLDFHALAPLSWLNLTIDNLTTADNFAKLEQLIVAAVTKEIRENQVVGKVFLRLKLSGLCPLYRELGEAENLLALEESLQALLSVEYLELKQEGLIPPLYAEEYKQGPHILSELLALLDSVETDDNLLQRLSPEILAGLSGNAGTKERIEYLRFLLKDLDYEAVARLVEVDGQ